MMIRKMKINDYEAVYTLWLSCKGMARLLFIFH